MTVTKTSCTKPCKISITGEEQTAAKEMFQSALPATYNLPHQIDNDGGCMPLWKKEPATQSSILSVGICDRTGSVATITDKAEMIN